MTARRFYLLKRREAARRADDALASTWQAKQEAELGTDLPDSFPSRASLKAAGYVAREDLDGATVDELVQVGLSHRDAAAVLSAL